MSYADKRRKPLEFEVGDRVLLKVSPWKGVFCAKDLGFAKASVSVTVSLLWIVDSERDRLIVVDRGTRSVPLFVMLSVTVSTWFDVNPSHALKDPNWRNAMYDEYNTLVKNGTWLLIPRPTGVNMVRSMWLFKHKFHADGTLSLYKPRLVANGSSQQLGVNFDKTFSPVVKPATVRTVLSLAVSLQQICLYMHDPREPHFAALKRILRYVRGIVDFGLKLYVSATTSLVGYTDADWAGCPSTRSSAVYMSANPVQHQRTKHIEIDIHFVCDMVTAGHVRVLHVPSRFQYADIFTKGLPTALFEDFRSSLSVRPPPAQTARAY
ncbi:ribonuclease H-like domain-containing protein [Tanacetum coccineum]